MAATGWPAYSTTPAASAGSSLRIGAMSFLPGISAAVTATDTPGAADRAREIDAADAGVGMRAQHQRGFERARHGRDIVDIARRAGDVTDGAVVAHGRVRPSANSCRAARS